MYASRVITPIAEDHPKEPNAFVAIAIGNEQAVQLADQIASDMLEEEPAIQPYLQPSNTLHISIFNTHVSPQRLGLAQEAMTEASNRLQSFRLHRHGVKNFGSKTLYGAPASTHETAALGHVHREVKKAFESKGFKSMRATFNPHMSLVNIDDTKMQYLGRQLFENYKKNYKDQDLGDEWVQGGMGVGCDLVFTIQHKTSDLQLYAYERQDGSYTSMGTGHLAEGVLDATNSAIKKKEK